MWKKLAGALVALLVVVGVGLAGVLYAATATLTDRDPPYPDLHADTSPEGVARGEAIFVSMCTACHLDPATGVASGKQLKDAPAFLGTFWSGNITSHETAGIGALTDAQIARALRYGVSRDGRWTAMGFAYGDDDIEAVLGFLRSGHPMLAPSPQVLPRTELTLVGRVILYLAGALELPDRPATGIPVPPRADKLAYGRYLAKDVFDCAGCHTAGFDPARVESEAVFTGGFEFQDEAGQPIVSKRIRFDDEGIGAWSRDDLAHAVRDGLRPDGSPLRFPMPKFRGLADDEVEALYVYLKSVGPDGKSDPARVQDLLDRPVEPVAAPAPSSKVVAGREADAFAALGCIACHGPGAPYADRLAAARGKDPAALAAWILDPQITKPGTAMPTYASAITPEDAALLAAWVSGGEVAGR